VAARSEHGGRPSLRRAAKLRSLRRAAKVRSLRAASRFLSCGPPSPRNLAPLTRNAARRLLNLFAASGLSRSFHFAPMALAPYANWADSTAGHPTGLGSRIQLQPATARAEPARNLVVGFRDMFSARSWPASSRRETSSDSQSPWRNCHKTLLFPDSSVRCGPPNPGLRLVLPRGRRDRRVRRHKSFWRHCISNAERENNLGRIRQSRRKRLVSGRIRFRPFGRQLVFSGSA
jgi:hypothetical protein